MNKQNNEWEDTLFEICHKADIDEMSMSWVEIQIHELINRLLENIEFKKTLSLQNKDWREGEWLEGLLLTDAQRDYILDFVFDLLKEQEIKIKEKL